MESVIVKQEEDWTYNIDGTAELEVKTELDQDVDLQAACESTVPNLLKDNPAIKEEPTDSFEESAPSQDSRLCSKIIFDTTIVKEEDAGTEAAVKENDEWLQRLAREWGNHDESLQYVKDEYDKDEETAVTDNTAVPKCSIPLTVGSRKFVLVPHTTRNAQLAVTNAQHKEQGRLQLSVITKLNMKVLEGRVQPTKNSNTKSTQPSVTGNATISIPQPILVVLNSKPGSKVSSTAKPNLKANHIVMQSPLRKTGSDIVKQYHSIPDCVFQPNRAKKQTSDVTKTNLKPAINNVLKRSLTINRITPLIITKKTTPLVPYESLNFPVVNNASPLVRSSYSNSSLVTKESTLVKQSQNLLNILETLKASKRAEAFKKVTCVPAETGYRKSRVANVRTLPRKTKKSIATSVYTKSNEILKHVNPRLPQLKEAKSPKTIQFISSVPTSQLELFLRPCFVKLDRLKPLTCAVCKQQFYLKSQFVQHVFAHVKTASLEPRDPCMTCGKYYPRTYLKIHQLKEHGLKCFCCDHCGKAFSEKANLVKHLVIHSDLKLFRCDVCKKRFKRKSNLLSHQQMHSSDEPYTCIICEKRFRRKTSLTKHSLYHLATRPHKCKICDKQYCQSSHLNRHMLVHTGERPYPCEICNMRFTRISHRKRHMDVHMRTKKFLYV